MSTSVIKSETVASAAAADDTPNAAGRARQREVMWDIQQRLVAHLAAGRTTDMSEAFLELRASIYSDEDRFRAERQKLFESLPLVAGLSCDIPNAGDTLTFDEVGPPILIVRGKDGVVRAFLNRCRHRAARLVDDCGHRARLNVRSRRQTDRATGRGRFSGPGPRGAQPRPRAGEGMVRADLCDRQGGR
jgi:hypothetical protein